MLNQWNRHRSFPDTKTLKKWSHDIQVLHAEVAGLHGKYGVQLQAGFAPDDLDKRLLCYFSDFAKASRYFNLDSITGEPTYDDPVPRWHALIKEVHQQDVPECKRIHEADQMDGMISAVEPFVIHSPRESMSGDPQSFREMALDQSMITHALPAMCLRLLKALIPLKELLLTICQEIHRADDSMANDRTVPYMEEFLSFVCKDRSIVDEPADEWP